MKNPNITDYFKKTSICSPERKVQVQDWILTFNCLLEKSHSLILAINHFFLALKYNKINFMQDLEFKKNRYMI